MYVSRSAFGNEHTDIAVFWRHADRGSLPSSLPTPWVTLTTLTTPIAPGQSHGLRQYTTISFLIVILHHNPYFYGGEILRWYPAKFPVWNSSWCSATGVHGVVRTVRTVLHLVSLFSTGSSSSGYTYRRCIIRKTMQDQDFDAEQFDPGFRSTKKSTALRPAVVCMGRLFISFLTIPP